MTYRKQASIDFRLQLGTLVYADGRPLSTRPIHGRSATVHWMDLDYCVTDILKLLTKPGDFWNEPGRVPDRVYAYEGDAGALSEVQRCWELDRVTGRLLWRTRKHAREVEPDALAMFVFGTVQGLTPYGQPSRRFIEPDAVFALLYGHFPWQPAPVPEIEDETLEVSETEAYQTRKRIARKRAAAIEWD